MTDPHERGASEGRSPRTVLIAGALSLILLLAGCAAVVSDGARETAQSTIARLLPNDNAVAQQDGGPARPDHPRKRYVVATEDAPEAIGPYSQAVGAGDFLFLAGQIPIDPSTGENMGHADIVTQTELVLSNLQAVLADVGLTMDDIVSTSVFLTDLDDFPVMNQTYATFFGDEPPARATVEVPRLPAGVSVEISAIAYAARGQR